MVKVIDNQPAGTTGDYTYSGLNYASAYNWQVVAMNTNGKTEGPVWSFSTLCGAINIFPFSENFDGTPFPPSCWERYLRFNGRSYGPNNNYFGVDTGRLA